MVTAYPAASWGYIAVVAAAIALLPVLLLAAIVLLDRRTR